jgi:hypothetical protein
VLRPSRRNIYLLSKAWREVVFEKPASMGREWYCSHGESRDLVTMEQGEFLGEGRDGWVGGFTSMAIALVVVTAKGLKGVTARATAVALPLLWGKMVRMREMLDSEMAQ